MLNTPSYAPAVFLILLVLPVNSYSDSRYQVDTTISHRTWKENIPEQKDITVSANIFFEEVEAGSHPYLDAAFLEHTSSLSVAYLDSKLTGLSFDVDSTNALLLLNYILPNSLHIFQIGYGISDANIKNGINGTFEVGTLMLGVGTYINNYSAVRINYSQQNFDVNIVAPIGTTSTVTDIDISYKLIEESHDGKAINFEAVITSSKTDYTAVSPSETNTIIELRGDYYLNQLSSVGISIENNYGDDKTIEGITLGLSTHLFFTQSFAIYAEYNQFNANSIFSVDSYTIELGGRVRF